MKIKYIALPSTLILSVNAFVSTFHGNAYPDKSAAARNSATIVADL
jgi:hypothetical protein